MPMKPSALLALILTLALTPAATAEEPATAEAEPNAAPANTLRLGDAEPGRGTIADVAWLSGAWAGEGLGGWAEEIWGQAVGDRMYGTFTLRKNDALVFSEHMVIVEEQGSLVLKVKHFTPEFSAWEEKDDFTAFKLVRLGENEAYFSGLTLRREGNDGLKIYLVLKQGEERTEHVFDMKAVH